jgi:hypothetical protein
MAATTFMIPAYAIYKDTHLLKRLASTSVIYKGIPLEYVGLNAM